MRFKWRRPRPSAPSAKSGAAPFNYSRLPEPEPATLDEMVSEGVMLAEFAGRQALKNRIIVGALGDPRPYERERYAEEAREVLSELARVSEDSAELAAKGLRIATGRPGSGRHQHDYRENDIANLRRRENVHSAVASRLSEMINDDDYLAGFVARARDDAWSEIGTAITARLDRQWQPLDTESVSSAEAERRRRTRIRRLQRELAQLEREHSRS
jgi:hypothetical protein